MSHPNLPPGDTPETDADLLAGFDTALETAGVLPEPEPEGAPAPTEAVPTEGEAPTEGEPPQPGGELKPTEGEPAPAARPSDEFGDIPKDAKAETRERFEKLRQGYDELAAPITAAIKAGHIKDASELPAVFERAKAGDDIIGLVRETGANSEQFGGALDYLSLANQASKGDLDAAAQCLAFIEKEQATWAKLLGKPVPGVHDPLAEHADLKDAVDAGDITEKYAMEVAANRAQASVRTHVSAAERNAATAQTEQAQAVQWLVQFDAQQQASDPHYAAKRPELDRLVGLIRSTMPPGQWAQATQAAYARIPDPVVVAAKPPPGPVRATGPLPRLQPQYDDPMEALNAGLDALR